jgi:hypothetical protein
MWPFATCGDRQFKCGDKRNVIILPILKIGNYMCNKRSTMELLDCFWKKSKSNEIKNSDSPCHNVFFNKCGDKEVPTANVFLMLDTTVP